MHSTMTIGKKLYLAFGAALLLTLLVSFVSWSSTSTLGASIDRLTKVNAKKLYLSGEVNTTTSDMVAEERGILIRSSRNDQAAMEKYNQEFHASSARLKKSLDEFASLAETEAGRQMIAELQTAQGKIAQRHEEFYRLASSGQTDAALQLWENSGFMKLVVDTSDEGDRLAQLNRNVVNAAGEKAASVANRSQWMTGILIVLALLVGAGILAVVQQINKGLRQVVAELAEGSEQVASAASQVSSSSQALAQGASEQAASLEETSASTEEINSMTRQNADNSKTAAESMVITAQHILDGNRKLDELVVSMKEITESSEKISKIIKAIDEIAFQTNILALNAAVEAARAGESGMGFAVVADEVRNLAQRCTAAAKDTAALIENSITKTHEGGRKLDEVSKALAGMTGDAEKVQTLVAEVSVGSQEQAKGLQQISAAITQMEQVTQKTAASSEEGAAAGEELSAQSESLRHIVNRLAAMAGSSASSSSEDAPTFVASRPSHAPRLSAFMGERKVSTKMRERFDLSEEFQEI
jgi:methyl-accepting chemotaxis protein/methyl-accepting chemotaxis protein-1 (serine sensor receptor)